MTDKELNLCNIESILWNALYESNVEKISLGRNLSLIGSYAFAFSSLKEIDLEDNEQKILNLSSSSFWAIKKYQ